jgi:pimeloyl-ACP methyl ester carboxylesterase
VQSSSDPVLLLHGQPGSAHDWDAVRAAIGARVLTLAIDRPGWDGRRGPTDLAGNARAALAELDARGIERATVVGHSLGGAIAAWLAAEYPHRVSSLVLAAPSASCESLNRLDAILATPFVGSALATGVSVGIGAILRPAGVRRRISARFGVPEGYLLGYSQALLNPLTWHAFSVEQRMLVHELPELESRLSAISAPTTIIIGTADRIVSPASARRLTTRVPGAELVELGSASHLLLQERPAEVAELIIGAASDGPAAALAADQDSLGSG